MRETVNEAAYQQAIKGWSKKARQQMKINVRKKTSNVQAWREALALERGITTENLNDSIRYKIYSHFGLPYRIAFPFAKHGFFLQVGASRGHPYKTNPRRKVDWYETVMEKRVPTLADIVMENTGDRAMRFSAIDPKTRRNIK